MRLILSILSTNYLKKALLSNHYFDFNTEMRVAIRDGSQRVKNFGRGGSDFWKGGLPQRGGSISKGGVDPR